MSIMAGPSGEEKPYCYSDASSGGRNHNIHFHLVSQLQNFEPNPQIYNLTAGKEMSWLPSNNLHTDENTILWKGFFDKPGGSGDGGGPSTSKEMNAPASCDRFYQNDLSTQHDLTGISGITSEKLMVSSTWNHLHHYQNRLLVDDLSLRGVFPCEGHERPSQGLSLSLNPSNYPSGVGQQPFELGPQDDLRFGPQSSRSVNVPQHSQVVQGHSHIRNSKYLGPAQDLLNEFCNLGTKQIDNTSKLKLQKTSDQDEDGVRKQSIYSLDLLELQKRKSKLFQMLEEVDRRYKHYCDQMKAVVSSFETVAGIGAASAYTALASKAMSRHFRCLRDGIVGQTKATKKAMVEKDTASPGTVKGQTPRLRILDQTVRQQRALQQTSVMESHPWRPQRGLPERSVSILRAWLFEHFLHPYPSDVDKHILARQTGLSRSQVSNWFINARVRLWKPMVEEMYSAELNESEGMQGTSLDGNPDGNEQGLPNQNISGNNNDQKPTHEQLVRMDSGCISSIINNPEKDDGKNRKTLQNEHRQNPSLGTAGDSYGAMQLDFSSYSQHSAGRGGATVSYVNELAGTHNHGGGVSLTLGLHQHGASGGVSLAFSPPSQSSLFYPREQMEDGQTVQYSLLDGESQILPYRNRMGAQLLHDLAG